jgi:hypothetical protein
MQSHHLLERFVPATSTTSTASSIGGESSSPRCTATRSRPSMSCTPAASSAAGPCPGAARRRRAAPQTRGHRRRRLEDGAFHAEFIRARDTGEYHFLEIAARVGGAHIADMVEAATGREPVARVGGSSWHAPAASRTAGPDTAARPRRRHHLAGPPGMAGHGGLRRPEVVWRLNKRHHAGLVVVAPGRDRVQELLDATCAGSSTTSSRPCPRPTGRRTEQHAAWQNGRTTRGARSGPPGVVGSIKQLEQVHSPQLGNARDLLVYLPPSYDDGDRRYPVIYMHDGQNLFDPATSFAGEWAVDQTLEAGQRGRPRGIVVAIPNMGPERTNEYSPFLDPKNGGGKGELYLRFIVETVKPHHRRRLPHARRPGEHTGIAGSSMGGLISLYASSATATSSASPAS